MDEEDNLHKPVSPEPINLYMLPPFCWIFLKLRIYRHRHYDMTCFLFRVSPTSMGDDGIMGKGVRYAPEFREKAVRLLAESRDSHSSGTRAPAQVARNPGVAPGTLRRWRNQADGAAAAQSAQDAQATCICLMVCVPVYRGFVGRVIGEKLTM